MSSHQYLSAFRRLWYVVLIGAVVGTLAGWGLSLLATPAYTATSSLYFSLNVGDNANDLAQGSTYTQNQMASFAQLATSPLVLSPVIEELNLTETPAQLADSINVSTPQETVVLELAVTNASAKDAAVIANAVATSLRTTVDRIAPKGLNGESTVEARVIQPAVTPVSPSSPNTRLNVLAGFLLGLIVGILIVVLRELLETRVHSTEIATELTGAPLLGTIDREKKAPISPILLRDPLSNASESYRQLRSNLEYVAVDSKSLSVVVTSSIPAEGKSTIATNLALALSEGELRVLLVDADLRRPAIASFTGIEGAAGLTTVLVGKASFGDVVQEWGPSGLHILTSGVIPPNPSELLSSRAMASLIEELRASYDVIVLDTAPMTAVADAAILGRLVDGTLVVVDRTQVRRSQLSQTMDSLSKSGVRVLGLVVNRVAPSKERQSYYYTATPAAADASAKKARVLGGLGARGSKTPGTASETDGAADDAPDPAGARSGDVSGDAVSGGAVSGDAVSGDGAAGAGAGADVAVAGAGAAVAVAEAGAGAGADTDVAEAGASSVDSDIDASGASDDPDRGQARSGDVADSDADSHNGDHSDRGDRSAANLEPGDRSTANLEPGDREERPAEQEGVTLFSDTPLELSDASLDANAEAAVDADSHAHADLDAGADARSDSEFQSNLEKSFGVKAKRPVTRITKQTASDT